MLTQRHCICLGDASVLPQEGVGHARAGPVICLHVLAEQYGLYGTTLAGLGYSALSWMRAHTLMLASLESNSALARKLMLKANAKEFDVERAVHLASEFRTRGLLAAIGAPMLWLGFLTASSALKRKRAAQLTCSASNGNG